VYKHTTSHLSFLLHSGQGSAECTKVMSYLFFPIPTLYRSTPSNWPVSLQSTDAEPHLLDRTLVVLSLAYTSW